MTGTNTAEIVIALIGGGGLLAGIGAFFKMRPERDSIVVTTMKDAMSGQAELADGRKVALDEARAELAVARNELREARAEAERFLTLVGDQAERIAAMDVKLTGLSRSLEVVKHERDHLKRENGKLRARVVKLEQQVAAVENGAS